MEAHASDGWQWCIWHIIFQESYPGTTVEDSIMLTIREVAIEMQL